MFAREDYRVYTRRFPVGPAAARYLHVDAISAICRAYGAVRVCAETGTERNGPVESRDSRSLLASFGHYLVLLDVRNDVLCT